MCGIKRKTLSAVYCSKNAIAVVFEECSSQGADGDFIVHNKNELSLTRRKSTGPTFCIFFLLDFGGKGRQVHSDSRSNVHCAFDVHVAGVTFYNGVHSGETK